MGDTIQWGRGRIGVNFHRVLRAGVPPSRRIMGGGGGGEGRELILRWRERR